MASCSSLWLSSYSGHTCPGILFEGVANRFAVWLSQRDHKSPCIFTSKYLKWYAAERTQLFATIMYEGGSKNFSDSTVPKIGSKAAALVFAKLIGIDTHIAKAMTGTRSLYIYTTPIHWVKAFDFMPYFQGDGKTQSTQLKSISVNKHFTHEVVSILNSSLFFFWWILHSDCYHLVARETTSFPFEATGKSADQIHRLSEKLMHDYREKSIIGSRNQKTTGLVRFQVIDPKLSKPIIDQIDSLLAQHYGFTHEDLDFVINYDIKYRMGKELNSGEDNNG